MNESSTTWVYVNCEDGFPARRNFKNKEDGTGQDIALRWYTEQTYQTGHSSKAKIETRDWSLVHSIFQEMFNIQFELWPQLFP